MFQDYLRLFDAAIIDAPEITITTETLNGVVKHSLVLLARLASIKQRGDTTVAKSALIDRHCNRVPKAYRPAVKWVLNRASTSPILTAIRPGSRIMRSLVTWVLSERTGCLDSEFASQVNMGCQGISGNGFTALSMYSQLALRYQMTMRDVAMALNNTCVVNFIAKLLDRHHLLAIKPNWYLASSALFDNVEADFSTNRFPEITKACVLLLSDEKNSFTGLVIPKSTKTDIAATQMAEHFRKWVANLWSPELPCSYWL